MGSVLRPTFRTLSCFALSTIVMYECFGSEFWLHSMFTVTTHRSIWASSPRQNEDMRCPSVLWLLHWFLHILLEQESSQTALWPQAVPLRRHFRHKVAYKAFFCCCIIATNISPCPEYAGSDGGSSKGHNILTLLFTMPEQGATMHQGWGWIH